MSLKSFFQKIGNFFSNLFKGLAPELKKAVDFGVTATNAIKNFDLSHPGAIDIISSVIPGDKDDKAVAAVRAKLPQIMQELRLVDSTASLSDPNEIVASAIKTIQTLSGDYRSTFLNSLSIIVAQVAADGKLSWDDASVLMKWYYDHKNNPETDTAIDSSENGSATADTASAGTTMAQPTTADTDAAAATTAQATSAAAAEATPAV